MPAGRPQVAHPGSLYAFAHQLYWELKRIEEGGSRIVFDEKLFTGILGDSARKHEYMRITAEDRRHHLQVIEQEIQEGRLEHSRRQERLEEIESGLRWAREAGFREQASDEARKRIRIPGEPDIIDALLVATSPGEILEICSDAFAETTREIAPGVRKELVLPNWPISAGSVLPRYLCEHAAAFIAAKSDPRFPRASSRPSTRLKQLWFLARALAGADFGIKTRTAINLVGSKRPEEIFEESRSATRRRSVRKSLRTKK